MRLPLDFSVLRRPERNARRKHNLRITSMAVGATQTHRSSSVHGHAVHWIMATNATSRSLRRFVERVAEAGRVSLSVDLCRRSHGIF